MFYFVFSFCIIALVFANINFDSTWNPGTRELQEEPLECDEVIEAVNNAHTTWKAGRNFPPALTKSYIKYLLGVKKQTVESVVRKSPKRYKQHQVEMDSNDLPREFDARKKWEKCKALQGVRDQGECGSCWAVSSVTAFTDRLCIATNAEFNDLLSVQDLVTCCSSCSGGFPGCEGGSPFGAWDYFESIGIVTGGDYNSHEGCKPYEIPNCNHHVSGRFNNTCQPLPDPHTPDCTNSCSNKQYRAHGYNNDKHKADFHFEIPYDNEDDIEQAENIMQMEIFTHGPIVASFDVYEDFFSYKSGVYQHTNNQVQPEYYHAVKVIGWGEEEGTPYWLVANSWNSDWGDNGFFKILRGINECGIEREVDVGYAKV